MDKRIRVKDLAPFASIEDLSDDENAAERDKQKTILSNIEEEIKSSRVTSTSKKTNNGAAKVNLKMANATPRIDVWRASTASHQEDSSSERELILGKANSNLEVAFGEEIAFELSKSTEELSFYENEAAEKNRWKKSSSQVVLLNDMHREPWRRDSTCSGDLAFLPISGRTSRISSLGSIASGCSGVSNVSVKSHYSASSHPSRGSSPHRTSVETSFCGRKPVHSISIEDKYAEIISKQTCPSSISSKTRIIEDQTSAPKQLKSQSVRKSRSMPARKRPTIENPKTQKFVSLYSDEDDKSVATDADCAQVDVPATGPQPRARKTLPGLDPRTQIYIPLRGDSIEEKTTDTSRKKDTSTTGKSNPFSFRRMRPFTNSIILNFISKYDAFRESPKKTEPMPRQNMYEEFQKFISLRDDDDFSEGGPRNLQHPKVDCMALQVQRSRSLNENMASASVKDAAKLSESDMRKPASISSTLLTNLKQPPLHLSDPLLKQHHCDSNDTNSSHHSHTVLATTSSSTIPVTSTIISSHPSPLDHNTTRLAKSMTQLSCRPEDNSNSLLMNISTSSNTVFNSAYDDQYPLKCTYTSKSAKEIQSISADETKSRSSSFKSRFRTFFKKNSDLKTEKTYNTNKKTEFESKPLQIQKVQTSSTGDSVVIIPLHSLDYDYEAAAAVSKTTSKNGVSGKTEINVGQ